ncbi:Ivy family c-type lysozyme inhibitor [Acetobacter indonesiensis]
MNPIKLSLIALCLATPAMAQDGPYTADMAQKPKFAKAYQNMTQLPTWVKATVSVSVPTKPVTVSGKTYTVGHLCKPHDCGDNQLDVIFSNDGKASWGLLSRKFGKTLYQMPLGEPDDAMLTALTASYRSNNPE